MLQYIANKVLSRAERELGVKLDYAREISRANFGLFLRYGKIFGFLDPIKHVPPHVYHAARLAAAVSADCGTCVEAEKNIAASKGLDELQIEKIVNRNLTELDDSVSAAVRLAFAVNDRIDDPDARAEILKMYGKTGLIELAFAMNGASLLPGIKRAMGHATECSLESR
jgi:alkylhydroperoxidase family enzyme